MQLKAEDQGTSLNHAFWDIEIHFMDFILSKACSKLFCKPNSMYNPQIRITQLQQLLMFCRN